MNTSGLLAALESRYKEKTPKSAAVHQKARRVMIDGGSHTLRLFAPHPFYVESAEGSKIRDIDGNAYVDYWQGHFANILGHNPSVILNGRNKTAVGGSLLSGFEPETQIELAETILGQLDAEGYKIRFTTSGTLATMYAVMLAKAWTGRGLVVKIGGGWHGASPYLLKGIQKHSGRDFESVESAGVPEEWLRQTVITRFNDGEDLERVFRDNGKNVAALILEPFLGAGGFLAASTEYLRLARRLTQEYGAVLIFDEIISGFRFCPSGLQTLYGIRPDLTTFGKLIGGGQAVSALAGKNEIMEGCGRGKGGKDRVRFEGGTFSSHPGYMIAGLLMIRHIISHAEDIYPRIGRNGERLRKGIEAAFASEGIEAKCTGYGNDTIKQSSMFMVHFPLKPIDLDHPDDLWNPAASSHELRENALRLALASRGIHVVHGGGSVSAAHTDGDIERTLDAFRDTAHEFKKHL